MTRDLDLVLPSKGIITKEVIDQIGNTLPELSEKQWQSILLYTDYLSRDMEPETRVICQRLKMDTRTLNNWLYQNDSYMRIITKLIAHSSKGSFWYAFKRLAKKQEQKPTLAGSKHIGEVLGIIQPHSVTANVQVNLVSYVAEDGTIQTKAIEQE